VQLYSQETGRSGGEPGAASEANRYGIRRKEGILIRNHRLLVRLLLICSLFLLPAVAGAQELYTYTAGVFGGLGGSLDADPGDSLSNTGYQLNLGVVTQARTHLVLRTGRLALDQDELFGSLRDAELTYATIGGEYRSRQDVYESGIYASLGGYRLEGTPAAAGRDSRENSWGLSVGVTGELPIRRWLGLQAEISGHYVDFDEAQIFAMGHAGLAFHF
jgi:hypothetical protein